MIAAFLEGEPHRSGHLPGRRGQGERKLRRCRLIPRDRRSFPESSSPPSWVESRGAIEPARHGRIKPDAGATIGNSRDVDSPPVGVGGAHASPDGWRDSIRIPVPRWRLTRATCSNGPPWTPEKWVSPVSRNRQGSPWVRIVRRVGWMNVALAGAAGYHRQNQHLVRAATDGKGELPMSVRGPWRTVGDEERPKDG
jgi:hypothetical protein